MIKLTMKRLVIYIGIAYLFGILLGTLISFSLIGQEMIDKTTCGKECAKLIMPFLQMNVACQKIGNVTSEQVKNQWIRMFLLNETGEGR